MNLSPSQFESLSLLLREQTAVVITSDKGYLIESRLAQIARIEGFPSIAHLIDVVLTNHHSPLARRVLLALTTHETSFFRDGAPFEAMRTSLIPYLIEHRRASRSLSIWSAACSSGQEPFSVAMLLAEFFPDLDHWRVSLRASDINPALLEQARAGVYSPLEVSRGLPLHLLEKHFSRVDAGYQVHDCIKSKVDFFEQNLVQTWPPFQADIILLRNVLIYFDPRSRIRVLKAIHRSLAPDGFLIMGTAENPRSMHSGFTTAQVPGSDFKPVSFIFQKTP